MFLDRILATLAALSVIAFFGIIAWRVPETDLTIVLVVVVLMMIYDFYRDLRPRRED